MSEEYLKPVIVAALLGVLTIVCAYVTSITDAPTEKTDSQIMQSRIEGTLMSGDYTYVVDGTELATLDNMTVANLRKYNVVIDTETKKVVLTTRPVNRRSTVYIPIYR